MKNIKRATLVLIFLSVNIFGEEHCDLPKSTEDIINCAMEFHPKVLRSSYDLEASKSLTERASQIPNPILSTKYIKGSDSYTSETSLRFPIELGGKRGARIELAGAKIKETHSKRAVKKAQVKIETILNLYRLGQIKKEKMALGDTLKAYAEVMRKLKSLSKLSPEQEASLSLFELAFGECKIQESILFEEERD